MAGMFDGMMGGATSNGSAGGGAGMGGGGFMSGLAGSMGGIGSIVGLGTSLFGLGKKAKTQQDRDELRARLFESKMRGLNLGGTSDEIASRRAIGEDRASGISGFGDLQRKGEGFLSNLS